MSRLSGVVAARRQRSAANKTVESISPIAEIRRSNEFNRIDASCYHPMKPSILIASDEPNEESKKWAQAIANLSDKVQHLLGNMEDIHNGSAPKNVVLADHNTSVKKEDLVSDNIEHTVFDEIHLTNYESGTPDSVSDEVPCKTPTNTPVIRLKSTPLNTVLTTASHMSKFNHHCNAAWIDALPLSVKANVIRNSTLFDDNKWVDCHHATSNQETPCRYARVKTDSDSADSGIEADSVEASQYAAISSTTSDSRKPTPQSSAMAMFFRFDTPSPDDVAMEKRRQTQVGQTSNKPLTTKRTK